jgi:hypothetical protein
MNNQKITSNSGKGNTFVTGHLSRCLRKILSISKNRIAMRSKDKEWVKKNENARRKDNKKKRKEFSFT